MIDPSNLLDYGVAVGVCVWFMAVYPKHLDKLTEAVNNNSQALAKLEGVISHCKRE